MDDNYWKHYYSGSWKASSDKEAFIKKSIEDETGLEITDYGLGAGSDEFISGSAAYNKKQKGDADLYIEKLNYFIEVTGPNIPVNKDADLWFRPDKIVNAENKYKANNALSFFVHIQKDRGTNNQQIRVLIVDKSFFEKFHKSKYELIHPYFGGKSETYYSIPDNDSSLISFERFIHTLNLKKKELE